LAIQAGKAAANDAFHERMIQYRRRLDVIPSEARNLGFAAAKQTLA
jgi:hypothetical protein